MSIKVKFLIKVERFSTSWRNSTVRAAVEIKKGQIFFSKRSNFVPDKMIWLLILCCISAKVIADEDQTFIAAHFIRRENRRLAGRAVARMDSSSVMSCCQACLRHSWCTSSNFEEALRNCELNKHEVSLINYDGELTEKKGTTFTMLLKVRNSDYLLRQYVKLSFKVSTVV